MSLFFLMATSGRGIITLTDATISDLVLGTAYVSLNTDGTVSKGEGTPPEVQINAATDWIIPNAKSVRGYQARWIRVSGTNPTYTNMTTADPDQWSAWYDLTTDRYIGYTPVAEDVTESGVITVAIGIGGETLDTANFTISARTQS